MLSDLLRYPISCSICRLLILVEDVLTSYGSEPDSGSMCLPDGRAWKSDTLHACPRVPLRATHFVYSGCDNGFTSPQFAVSKSSISDDCRAAFIALFPSNGRSFADWTTYGRSGSETASALGANMKLCNSGYFDAPPARCSKPRVLVKDAVASESRTSTMICDSPEVYLRAT